MYRASSTNAIGLPLAPLFVPERRLRRSISITLHIRMRDGVVEMEKARAVNPHTRRFHVFWVSIWNATLLSTSIIMSQRKCAGVIVSLTNGKLVQMVSIIST